ncbi:diguanylate cyclase (GGDEF)-like protein [Novosphingobium sp. PhB165]|uniref:GGDEF domain-containing protein n=1 Tax=Novosphingobium sp. PhB165 TaxID=2485105 RepID=UPI00104C03C7|nr:GGDEF domain-containing protein [Novosphingobium sp. PhB165]TCM18948.1 diguanylate cyclase (GGDEF)-like protein [Novosphingobium sp. PhB165]
MRFYRATSFLFPRRYEWRLLLACLAAVLVPMLAVVAFAAATGRWDHVLLAVTFCATVLGAALGLSAIHALVTPLREAVALLAAAQRGERLAGIPRGGNDTVGLLLQSVATAAATATIRAGQPLDAARRDRLTGLRNRHEFLDSAERVLAGQGNAVLALIDIDHFASLSGRFGPTAGDALLRAVAGRIDAGMRRTDLVARWSAEAFAVILPDTQLDEARLVMERLRASIALDSALARTLAQTLATPEHDGTEGEAISVTFSCALAPLRSFAQLGEATHRAESTLSAAHSVGSNRVRIAGNG